MPLKQKTYIKIQWKITNYVTVESILHWSRAHMYMFRIAINNKLFEWLFSRVLASHRGGPGFDSRPGDGQFLYLRRKKKYENFTFTWGEPPCLRVGQLTGAAVSLQLLL